MRGLLMHPHAVAPAALGLALQRLDELSYGPNPLTEHVVHLLLAMQADSGQFGGPDPAASLAATAVACRGLLRWRDAHADALADAARLDAETPRPVGRLESHPDARMMEVDRAVERALRFMQSLHGLHGVHAKPAEPAKPAKPANHGTHGVHGTARADGGDRADVNEGAQNTRYLRDASSVSPEGACQASAHSSPTQHHQRGVMPVDIAIVRWQLADRVEWARSIRPTQHGRGESTGTVRIPASGLSASAGATFSHESSDASSNAFESPSPEVLSSSPTSAPVAPMQRDRPSQRRSQRIPSWHRYADATAA
jgi:hypothetical protein